MLFASWEQGRIYSLPQIEAEKAEAEAAEKRQLEEEARNAQIAADLVALDAAEGINVKKDYLISRYLLLFHVTFCYFTSDN